MDALHPMTIDKIVDPGHPEKTLQNVTDYLYQNLGNQIVKVPVTALLGKVDSLATLTGMSAASVSANLHAKLLDKTGQAHVGKALGEGGLSGMRHGRQSWRKNGYGACGGLLRSLSLYY